MGTGNTNTNKIVNSEGSENCAAKICADLDIAGYNDWFLPSKDELNKLFENRTTIGGFTSDTYRLYWSSSEAGLPYAWFQDFNQTGPSTEDYNMKFWTLHVRAIRYF